MFSKAHLAIFSFRTVSVTQSMASFLSPVCSVDPGAICRDADFRDFAAVEAFRVGADVTAHDEQIGATHVIFAPVFCLWKAKAQPVSGGNGRLSRLSILL